MKQFTFTSQLAPIIWKYLESRQNEGYTSVHCGYYMPVSYTHLITTVVVSVQHKEDTDINKLADLLDEYEIGSAHV